MHLPRYLQSTTSPVWLRPNLALFLAVLLLPLSGCSTTSKNLLEREAQREMHEEAQKIRLVYPRPSPLNLSGVRWNALASKNLETTGKDLIEAHRALMCISGKDYENAASNWAEVRRYIEQTNLLIEKYEAERREDNER